MFRRKDNEAGDSATGSPSRGTADVKPMPQPDMPRRTNELPSASASASSTSASAAGASAAGASSAAKASASKPAAETGGKRLMVGQGISLSGVITACDRLIVEGSVQVTLNETKAIEIAESGRFTDGKAEVEDAEISGTYEGELTVRNRLLIRATGKVKGMVRYGELEIERGGRLTGTVSMIEDR